MLVSLEGEWNRVRLAEGQFFTRLYRFVANTQFSPWISLVNNIQYDSVSAVVGWQSRFRWILRPGNDVYFVYAQLGRGARSVSDARSPRRNEAGVHASILRPVDLDHRSSISNRVGSCRRVALPVFRPQR